MKRDEQLTELEKILNKVFESFGCTIPEGEESKAELYRCQLQQMYYEAYTQGVIDCMPEAIKVSVNEVTGELNVVVEWPMPKTIKCTIQYTHEKTE